MNAVAKEQTYRDSQHKLMALYMGGGNSDLYAAARKLETDRAALIAALQKLVDVVDPIVPGQRPKLEPFFVEPVKQARATLAKVQAA